MSNSPRRHTQSVSFFRNTLTTGKNIIIRQPEKEQNGKHILKIETVHPAQHRLYFRALLSAFVVATSSLASDGNIFSECSDMKYCKNDYLDNYISLGLDGDLSVYTKRITKNNCCIISAESYLIHKPFNAKNGRKSQFALVGSILGIDKFYSNKDRESLFMLREVAGANTNCIEFFILKSEQLSKVKNGTLCSQGSIPAVTIDRENDIIKVELRTFLKRWKSEYYYYNSKKYSMDLKPRPAVQGR